MKIRGNTVGTTLPKPNLDQTDPTKGDYIKGNRSFTKGDPGYTPVKGTDYFDGVDGVNGKDGYTPVKGVDYFTDSDKAEMVNNVIAALPIYSGAGIEL